MRISKLLALGFLAAGIANAPALSDDKVWVTGRVYAVDGKSPLSDATVAVYDDKNHVADYAKTDKDGQYSVLIPRSALHIDKSGGGGFIRTVINAVSAPIMLGAKIAGKANMGSDVSQIGVGVASGVTQNLIDSARGSKGKNGGVPIPGAIVMKVTRADHTDVVALGKVYWMQTEVHSAGGKEQKFMAAWVDPALLSDAKSSQPSTITANYLTFTNARLEPSIAEIGQTVSILATLPNPPDPRTPVIVIAKDVKTNKTFLLEPVGESGQYRGEFKIDKSFPKDDQQIFILAYAEQSDKPGRSKRVEEGINHWGFWDPTKPFIYNPLIVASRSRAEVTLTVVEPAKRRKP